MAGNNYMTIQLSAPALEKLIELNGGDEFVLSLRKATIENVLKGRIKALAADPLIKGLEAQIAAEVRNQVGEIKKNGYGVSTITLQPEFLTEVQRKAITLVSDRIAEAKAEAMKKADEAADAAIAKLKPSIDKYIEGRIDKGIAEYVSAEVTRRLQLALKG